MTEIASIPPPRSDGSCRAGWSGSRPLVGGSSRRSPLAWSLLVDRRSLLSTVTASILVAAIVAATFAPFVLALRNRGWSRIKAAAAVFLGAMAVIIATIVLIALAFIPNIVDVVAASRAGVAALKSQLADRVDPA